jgi:hypothetical protein
MLDEALSEDASLLRSLLFLLTAALCVLAPARPVRSETGTWSTLHAGDPTLCEPMWGHTLTRDPARDRLILLGWVDYADRNDVWTFPLSGAPRWTRLAPTGGGPALLYGHSAVLDPVADRIVVFGGSPGTNEVWALSLAGPPAWTQLFPLGTPPPGRSGHSAVYDAARRRMIVFGGTYAGLNDVWALSLDGTPRWTSIAAAGTPPSTRTGHAAVVDAAGDRLIVFGGWHYAFPDASVLNDVWQLSLAGPETWTQLAPPGTPPPVRMSALVDFDAARRRMIVFGGHSWYGGPPLADTWALGLDPAPAWSAGPAGGPPATGIGAAVVDAPRDRFLTYGGLRGVSGGFSALRALPLATLDPWSLVTPTLPPGLPAARLAPNGLVDEARDRLLVLGGHDDANGFVQDFWAHDLGGSAAWQDLGATAGAPAAGGGWTAYDPVGDRLLLLFTASCDPFPYGRMDDLDALRLDPLGTWSQLAIAPSEAPVGRFESGVFVDAPRDRLLLVEGTGYSSRSPVYCWFDDVWALPLDTGVWRNLVPWSQTYQPPGRGVAALDPLRDRVLVFPAAGGAVRAFPLATDGPWQNLAWTPGPAPGPRLFYDSGRDRLLAWGAGETLWMIRARDGEAWTQLSLAGDPPRAPLQPIALDAAHDRLLVFGGSEADNGLYAITFDVATPVTLSLVRQVAEPGAVTLAWWGAGTVAGTLEAERRSADAPWRRIASLDPDGQGRYALVDRTVEPGARYGYRLVSPADGGVAAAEAWVEVPLRAVFALRGAVPNPAARGLRVAFSLPDAAPARLALFDLLGRRLAEREVSDLGAGAHTVPLGDPDLRPGVYVLRLERGGQALVARALAIR